MRFRKCSPKTYYTHIPLDHKIPLHYKIYLVVYSYNRFHTTFTHDSHIFPIQSSYKYGMYCLMVDT